MRIFGWIITVTFWTLIVAFFHYTLPQKDIVRVTETENRRMDLGENSLFWASPDSGGDLTRTDRDVFFIQTVKRNGRVMAYRNEDTGWGWPPYFKFDTFNLQAEAADLRSTAASPQWAIINHYGWRLEFFTIFPNAISIRPVEGPDASKGLPWINILVLTLFAMLTYAIWVRWRRFRAARIDPALEEIEDNWIAAGEAAQSKRSRIRRWFASWRS
ncbi:MAG: DUF1523 family protein [Pseudomonadota bacterium]